MSEEAERRENGKCRENCNMEIIEKFDRKDVGAEKEVPHRKTRRYLIGCGILTKIRKTIYTVHYE